MPIRGEELEFDLKQIKLDGIDFVALHVAGKEAQLWCRWELEANQYQVAAALERLAARLRQDEPI
jgi:hypothetical protein